MIGPLGAELQNNIKRVWWKWMTQLHDDVYPINGAIITHPKVWEASGHVQNFTDPLVDCKKCHKRFRADHLVEEFLTEDAGTASQNRLDQIAAELKSRHIVCPECGGEFTEVRKFNLMVETSLGVVEGEKMTAYLKGEACQTIYLDYQNVLNSTNAKISFGICQMERPSEMKSPQDIFYSVSANLNSGIFSGLSTPKRWINSMSTGKQKEYSGTKAWLATRIVCALGQHDQNELAHYAKKAFDIEYETPFGWKEWEGIIGVEIGIYPVTDNTVGMILLTLTKNR